MIGATRILLPGHIPFGHGAVAEGFNFIPGRETIASTSKVWIYIARCPWCQGEVGGVEDAWRYREIVAESLTDWILDGYYIQRVPLAISDRARKCRCDYSPPPDVGEARA